MTRLLAALAVLANIAGPQPRDLQCPNCRFWYQEGSGHSC